MMQAIASLPFRWTAACLLAAASLASANGQPAAASYRITGVVVNSVTGNPVPRCHLDATLAPEGQGRTPGRRPPAGSNGADADEHGRFSLALPSAGAWRLTASAPGYVTQAYDEHDFYSSSIVLNPSAPAMDLQFRLPPQGRISGAVLDEAGEAVRNATVELLIQSIDSPEHIAQPFTPRGFAQTDDRGVYEFADLPPANYRLAVQAKPWYATSARPRQLRGATATGPGTTDASLDVTYQQTWYPGVDDQAQAESLTLNPGDDRPADFHLAPIPALHLQIIPPQAAESASGRPIASFPMIERIDSGGINAGFTQTSSANNPQGQIDISGLAPGTYRVRLQGQNQDARSAVVVLAEGSSRTIDFNAAASAMANIIVRFDNGVDDARPMMVELTDTATGQRFLPVSGGRPMPMRRGPQMQLPRETTLQVPPGRYEVNVQNRGDAYLAGISAQGAEVAGHILTVHEGDVVLTLHTATGHATITGTVSLGGKPSVGAMVMLVPAGLDDPGSFTTLERDQSNTDGSFDLNNIVPGQYILIAIDHGWHVNWHDPETLRNYLTQGVPLNLRPGSNIKQDIDAQAP